MLLNVVNGVEILPVPSLLCSLKAEQVQRCPVVPIDSDRFHQQMQALAYGPRSVPR
jgi:hypothetical protein